MGKVDDVMRDKAQVRNTFYRDPAKLGAREELHRRFQVPPLPMADWVLDLVDLSRVERYAERSGAKPAKDNAFKVALGQRVVARALRQAATMEI